MLEDSLPSFCSTTLSTLKQRQLCRLPGCEKSYSSREWEEGKRLGRTEVREDLLFTAGVILVLKAVAPCSGVLVGN